MDDILSLGKVYPRVCGGTGMALRCRRRDWGLSPRVRGNLRLTPALDGGHGSIPACAGEPRCVSSEPIS